MHLADPLRPRAHGMGGRLLCVKVHCCACTESSLCTGCSRPVTESSTGTNIDPLLDDAGLSYGRFRLQYSQGLKHSACLHAAQDASTQTSLPVLVCLGCYNRWTTEIYVSQFWGLKVWDQGATKARQGASSRSQSSSCGPTWWKGLGGHSGPSYIRH